MESANSRQTRLIHLSWIGNFTTILTFMPVLSLCTVRLGNRAMLCAHAYEQQTIESLSGDGGAIRKVSQTVRQRSFDGAAR
jgi:hypothetical protein